METNKNEQSQQLSSQMSKSSDIICGVVEGFYGRPWTTEQRRHLFKELNKLGMNTYLYAPKDDQKHRAEWRVLYTAEESELLVSLIRAAKENHVTFVYALSPGIDIIYSSPKEIKAIKDKLSQVQSMGCTAFALLFDDIETSMNEQDRKHFPSFVMAQLTVSNVIYEYLDYPMFFFCPTEYCESRAVPSLEDSSYLSTLGEKLHPNIHIMWTGPRVVSRLLTVEHMRRVSKVIRRKPLIWDNLHANDYDPKRVFLGPFAGRSVELKREVSGLLLNPNCKYEANFVPFRTLADWNQSDYDAPRVEEDENATLEAGLQKAAEQAVERGKPFKLYHPLTSLQEALEEWVYHYSEGNAPPIPPISQIETHSMPPLADAGTVSCVVPPPSIRTCEGNDLLPIGATDIPPPLYTSPMGSATTVTVQTFPICEAVVGVAEAHDAIPQTVNSLSVDYNEPMDALTDTKDDASPMETAGENSDVAMDETEENDGKNGLNSDLLALFVDMFYLPFESGVRGIELLEEFQWLHENSQVVRRSSINGGLKSPESAEWIRRADAFHSSAEKLTRLYRLVMDSSNKSLIQEIFPYLWDAHAITSMLSAILAWMGNGNLFIAPVEAGSWWNNAEVDVEPWALGGGLLADLQKLVVATPNLADIFLCRNTLPLTLNCYSLRPARVEDFDKEVAFKTMSTQSEREFAASVLDQRQEDLFFDKTFAPFFKYGVPSHNFIAEEYKSVDTEKELSATALAILNVAGIIDDVNSEFLSQYKAKYGAILQDQFSDGQLEQRTQLLHEDIKKWPLLQLNQNFLEKYSSLVEIRWRNTAPEGVSVRRLLLCTAATLSLNGAHGFFTFVPEDNRHKIGLLTRLGLHQIDDVHVSGHCVLGHLL